MRLDSGLHPGPGGPLPPLEDGLGRSCPEAGLGAGLGAGPGPGVYHQPVTVARPLGAPVPPVLGVSRQPAPVLSRIIQIYEELKSKWYLVIKLLDAIASLLPTHVRASVGQHLSKSPSITVKA